MTPVANTSSRTPQPAPTKLRLAGMALSNGVLIIGPTWWAASVRDRSGTIHTATRKRRTLGEKSVDRLPMLRGPIRLAEMLAVLPAVRLALPQARLAIEHRSMLGGTLAGGLIAGVLRRTGPGRAAELAASGLSLATVLLTLKGGEVAQYHGAEHKVIGAYEQDIDAVDATKEHERCGTHLAVPMIVANVVGNESARALLPGRPRAARTLGAVGGIALATEFARLLQRGNAGPLGTLARRTGMSLQSLASTEEPTPEQLEVAEAAIAALLEAEAYAA